MTTFFHPLRALRENLRQIGAAVNASREYARAGDDRCGARHNQAGIPL